MKLTHARARLALAACASLLLLPGLVAAQPGPPPVNIFATLTEEQDACLRAAIGDDALAELVAFSRPPTPDENAAIKTCGVGQPLPPPGAPPGPPPPTAPAMQLPRDETHVATSTDGIRWTIRGRIAEKASVPDVLLTLSGEVRAYWVDFSAFTGPLTERIGTGRSLDGGITWGQLATVTFEGLDGRVPVDPDVVQLPDGRFRMYFLDFAQQRGDHQIHSAISDDGLYFVAEDGPRYVHEKIWDPDVVRLADGSYRMFLNHDGSILSASSPDGLEFTYDEGVRLEVRGSVPGSLVMPDGSIRLYACPMPGLGVYRSTDGLTFSLESALTFEGPAAGMCDPSPAAVPGGYVLVYKVSPPPPGAPMPRPPPQVRPAGTPSPR